MKIFGTTIYAINPLSGEMSEFAGPNIKAPTRVMAFEFCQLNGFGYCHIEDELVMEIPCKEGTYEPDFNNLTDYDAQNNN